MPQISKEDMQRTETTRRVSTAARTSSRRRGLLPSKPSQIFKILHHIAPMMRIEYRVCNSIFYKYTPTKAAVTVIDAHSSRQLGTRMREHAAIFPMNRNAEIAVGAAVFSLAYLGPLMDSKADCTMKLNLQKEKRLRIPLLRR